MIAVDTSTAVDWLKGVDDRRTALMAEAFTELTLVLPPVVVTELLTYPAGAQLLSLVEDTRLAPISEGYWTRAGESRRLLKAKGLKAKLADTLIAQCCIDAGIPLIATDTDFRHFAAHCGLQLA
ncbi:PIN domain-containing protein [Brevundimonas sp.]|uniref:PIN domain-containing protein n=1 Tax=Brevundimonas sp. TaxID=1871086 RepID=UPI0037C026A9